MRRITAVCAFVLAGCADRQSVTAPPVAEAPTAIPRVAPSLAFVASPRGAIADGLMAPLVAVVALDSTGSPIAGFRGTVTISLGQNAGFGSLHGTVSVAAADSAVMKGDSKIAASGAAAFVDLLIRGVGATYTLVATADGFRPATSAPFDVVHAGRVAFVDASDPPDGKSFAGHVYVLDVDAGTVSQITSGDSVRDAQPSWSPDGSRIAFRRADVSREGAGGFTSPSIFVVNADGTGLRRLTSSDGQRVVIDTLYPTAPTWSPDGRQIAFVADGEVYVIGADGTGAKRLTDARAGGYYFFNPRWSPDGATIASDGEAMDPAGQFRPMRIYLMNADGSNIRRLTNDCSYFASCAYQPIERNPSWSPDGKSIAFDSEAFGLTVVRRETFAPSRGPLPHDAFAMLLNSAIGFDAHPDWSPDGNRVVYRQVDGQLYTALVDGSRGIHRLTSIPGGVFEPTWSPR